MFDFIFLFSDHEVIVIILDRGQQKAHHGETNRGGYALTKLRTLLGG